MTAARPVAPVVLVAGACLFGMGAAEAKPPPSIDVELREQATLRSCASQPVVTVVEREKQEELRQAGFAVPIDYCMPSYSKTLIKEMRRRRLSAACGTLYDVDRAGVGVKVETRCDIQGNKLDDDWRRFFETLIADAVARAADARLKFEPAASDAPETREGFVAFNLNAGGTEMPPMTRFRRAEAR